jgi:peptidoglycan hydrolase-like protein with peptidoglycan-binding domain
MTTSVAILAVACGTNDAAEETTPSSSAAPADPVAVAQTRVDDAEAGVSAAEEALTAAHLNFCGTAEDYVEILDRYGRVFTDRSASVGDVQTLGADLVEPRAEVVTSTDAVEAAKVGLAAAEQELVDAEAALAAAIATASSLPAVSTTPTTVATTTLVAASTVERVQLAEEDFARTAEGIDADTPLIEAGAAYNSAALALQIAWLKLLNEGGCFSDERQADALEQLTAYTTALQTDLQRAGYDPGPIDGVYGPQTVAAVEQLQTDSGLPVTGFVDEATARALQGKLDAVGQAESMQTASLQTILTATGFWTGPIDGVWTDELTKALQDLQTTLGVPPTGQVDAATVAAFQQKQADLVAAATSVTTATETATETATATATAKTTATETAKKTTTAKETATVTVTAYPEPTQTTDPEPTESTKPADG